MPSLRGRKLCIRKDYSKAINLGMKNQARRKALKIIARLYRHTKKGKKKENNGQETNLCYDDVVECLISELTETTKPYL